MHTELRKLIKMINIPELERFQNMMNEIYKVMEKYLQHCLIPTEDMIKSLIEIELGYINTNHPDFCGGANAMMDVLRLEDEAKEGEKLIPSSKNEGNNPKIIRFSYLIELLMVGDLFFNYYSEEIKNKEGNSFFNLFWGKNSQVFFLI